MSSLERAAQEKFKPDELQVMSFDIRKVDRAVNEDDRLGLLKMIAHRNGVILGATIVGERAGETITEIAVAMRNQLKLSDLASTVYPYPTYSTGVQQLAAKMAVERKFSGSSGKWMRRIAALWR